MGVNLSASAMVGWVRGEVEGKFLPNGRIVAHFSGWNKMPSPKPRSFEESGSDIGAFRRFWRYQNTGCFEPGPFKTIVHPGGATAILVPTNSVIWRPGQMGKIHRMYGNFRSLSCVAMVRQTAANAVWNQFEFCGGMAEDFDLRHEQATEIAELGVFRKSGWCRFLLPYEMREYQDALDAEQRSWWETVRPGFPCKWEAQLRTLSVGEDELDEWKCLLVAGPVGDFTVLNTMWLGLIKGRWMVRDTESRKGRQSSGEPEIVPLDRQVVVVAERYGSRSPLVIHLSRNGGIDTGMLHIPLSCEALHPKWGLSTHLGRVLFGPRGLNWLKEVKR